MACTYTSDHIDIGRIGFTSKISRRRGRPSRSKSARTSLIIKGVKVFVAAAGTSDDCDPFRRIFFNTPTSSVKREYDEC